MEGVEFWAVTFDFVGKILVAIMALMVHAKERRERKIDLIVIKEMHIEEILGSLGIALIIIGYFLKVQFL